LLDVRQLNNLLFLLPIAHRISTQRELVRQVFELILGVPIEIRSIPPLRFLIDLEPDDEPAPNELCRAELGSFSLGGEYQDTMPGIELKIGPLSTDQLIDFIGNGRSRAILNLLIGYFLPAEIDVTDHLEVDAENQFLTLSTDETPSGVLGVASYI
jgi:predicted component of type VI protein secretion system